MKLPDNSIGISDIMDYRECPQRFVFSMRRHVELPERLQLEPNEKDEPPEKTNYTNAYGSAIHDCIHLVEKTGMSHERAIEEVMKRYGIYLEPGDIAMLREDLNTYERRRPLGVTLVGTEMELRVPLFMHEGEQIYFRFRLDVLQRLISNPAVFVHRDYKSSKWQRTDAEVHKDPQMWAYNWGIHEYFPECKTLLQTYDQLKFGEVQTTKNDEQRRNMKQWLIDNVKIILSDETYKPKANDFCRFCPLVLTCREPRRLAKSTQGKLSLLAPLTKEGRRIKVEFFEEGQELERIIEKELPQMMQTRKHIEHVEKALKEIIAQMPQAERERLGWRLQPNNQRTISGVGLRELHEAMGDTFYSLISLPITRLEEHFGGKPKKGELPVPELQIARNHTEEVSGAPKVVPAKSG
jgi:hypothetical protein